MGEIPSTPDNLEGLKIFNSPLKPLGRKHFLGDLPVCPTWCAIIILGVLVICQFDRSAT